MLVKRLPKLFALSLLLIAALAACQPTEIITQEIELDSGDITTYARITGPAEAEELLIAINGGPGLSSHYMASLEKLADSDLAVLTYDQRGTGRSSRPANVVSNFELAEYTADLEALRQEFGYEKINLLGHSWGGILAMHYTIMHPGRVSSLVLTGSGPPTRAAIEAGQNSFTDRVRQLQDEGVIPRSLPTDGTEQLATILPAYFADPSFPFQPGEAEYIENDDTTNQLSWKALGDYDLTAEIGRLSMPVLILWGKQDPFGLPMAYATRDAFTGTEVDFILLDQCGHFWHECEEEFLDQAATFLK